jgi:MOSC domain-containing protein YiiM
MIKEVYAMRLISLNIGKPMTIQYQGKPLQTGIFKQPVEGEIRLSTVNLQGDGQADLVNHGGLDKAVCVYPAEHYAYWEEQLKRQLPAAAFGENFTVQGMTEGTVHIGDIYAIGSAIVQVSQPRRPCFKLGKLHETPDLPVQVQETGFTGYYFRVLQEGIVASGQAFELLKREESGISVAEVNRVKFHDKEDVPALRRILEVEALAASWRESFGKKLSELEGSEEQ